MFQDIECQYYILDQCKNECSTAMSPIFGAWQFLTRLKPPAERERFLDSGE